MKPTLFVLLLCCSSAIAAPPNSPWPGGIGVLRLFGAERPTVMVGDKPALILREAATWVAVFAVPLEQEAPGVLEVTVSSNGIASYPVLVDIRENHYREQRLNVDRRYVEPSQDQLDRILSERKIIDDALNNRRDVGVRHLDMLAPLAGRRSSSFGLRRFFNDQPRSPHKGMDIAAGTGTPIAAPLAGVVSATGDFYFNGNTVIIDHGQGFVSLYCHLSEITAEFGQEIETGTVLGKVGATGRVTGPHLHFATYLNGNAVDPALFLIAEEEAQQPPN